MASGTITLINDTNMRLSYNIAENGNYTTNWVASGVIAAYGQENVPVSGYDLYQVNFGTVDPTTYNAQQVGVDSEVVFSVSSDPDLSADTSE